MKKKKLNTKIRSHARIIEAFNEIDDKGFFNLFTVLYNSETVFDDYGHLISADVPKVGTIYLLLCGKTAEIISNMESGYRVRLDILIKRIQRYFRSRKYNLLSADELLKQCDIGYIPAIHDDGICAMMILFYYLSMNIFDGNEFEKVKAASLKETENNKKEQERAKPLNDIMYRLADVFENSEYEIELNVAAKQARENVDESIDFDLIAERLHCDYDPDKMIFNNVKQGVLDFLFHQFEQFLRGKKNADMILAIARQYLSRLMIAGDKQRALKTDRQKLKMENLKLLRKIKSHKRHVAELTSAKPKKKSPDELERENAELRKQNYYMKSRIEALENDIAELEEEKRINKDIEENLPIKKSSNTGKGIDPNEYFSIVISGGHWNSRKREEVTGAFPNNDITFIPAERTIRNIDTIENADLVLFDRSRHSHGYYYLVKKKASKMMHINKSSLNELESFFDMEEENDPNLADINEDMELTTPELH